MDEKLQLKEQQYMEMNKNLDIRTRELLKKLDHIHNKEIDDLLRVQSASEPLVGVHLKQNVPRSQSATAAVAKFTVEELKLLNLPEDVNSVGSRGFVHFLKTKAKQLQLELDGVKLEHKARCDELKKLQKDNVKLQEDREKFLQQGNAARCQITKLESQLSVVHSKLQSKEGESCALAKELDALSRELNVVKGGAHHGEVRCQRALEELSKVKQSMRTMQQNEKDLVLAHRQHSSAMSASIKRLEKQKAELLAGFKKQRALIDNLKLQRANAEAMQSNAKAESDFIKMMVEGGGGQQT